jgi:hypothetical protein
MIDLDLLDGCIGLYEDLKNLQGITAQVRGQRLNDLIAQILAAHHIDARASQQTPTGEIDVSFRVNDKRVILEAKWESRAIDINPIAKLGLRINQRFQNTIGVILSMSGYTQPVIDQMAQAGRPDVLLFGRDIFEAMLYGVVEADELFEACLDVAAFEGRYCITLADVLKYTPRLHPEVSVDESIRTATEAGLQSVLRPKGSIAEFEVLKADLPFGQNGISIAGSTAYITLTDGIYAMDNQRFVRFFAIDNPQNRCIHSDQAGRTVFIRSGSAVSVDRAGNLSIVSKQYPGHVRLFGWGDEVNLISNGDDFVEPAKPVRLVRDLIGAASEVVCDYPVGCCVDACVIDEHTYAVIGSSGLFCYKHGRLLWRRDVLNGAAVTSQGGSLFFLENGVRLKSVDLDGGNETTLVAFALAGSVGDFAIREDREFYFHLCYQDGCLTKSCVTRVVVR